jgi:hypothetical protein
MIAKKQKNQTNKQTNTLDHLSVSHTLVTKKCVSLIANDFPILKLKLHSTTTEVGAAGTRDFDIFLSSKILLPSQSL